MGNPPEKQVEFIPYHAHYDAHTLITDNGELMQIIKIAANKDGQDYENGSADSDGQENTVREVIRRALLDSAFTDEVAFWLHTVRRRKPIRYHSRFTEPFAAALHERWEQNHRWKFQYYNEVYLTVLYQGQSARILDPGGLRKSSLPGINRKHRNAYLEEAYARLDGMVSSTAELIAQHYTVHRLSVAERLPPPELGITQPIFYSEPMEFIGLLVNLRSEPFPLREMTVKDALPQSGLTFGFNAVEARAASGKRRFAAILSLKQYREVPIETVDRLMQAPIEFIVTQTFNFVPYMKALKEYKEQKQFFDISGDAFATVVSGIEEMMLSHTDTPTDFGDQQTTIMVLADEYRQIDRELAVLQTAFAELGLVTIREDIRLEECFWSQLPANFPFIRRKEAINTARVGGFCRLNRFPFGKASGNHWGEALLLAPTIVNSPYFFNFHHEDNGHTLLFDFNSFHDHEGKVLLYFLLAEARKYDGRLVIFDRNRSAQLFMERLGGDYHTLAPVNDRETSESRRHLRLNPFGLEDNPRNRGFLLAWCSALLSPDMALDDAKKTVLRDAIARLYEAPPERRHLVGLLEAVAGLDAPLAREFSAWHGEGRLAGLVDAQQEALDFSHSLHAFDLSEIAKRRESIIPVFAYLLHRLIMAIDGRPSIVVIHEADTLLENAFFAPRLESLLEMLRQSNVMVIFTTSRPFESASTRSFATLMQQCATRLYLPDDVTPDYAAHAQALGLDAAAARQLARMDRQRGEFLLMQGGETVELRVDVDYSMDDIRAILSNDIKTLAALKEHFNDAEEA